MRPKPNIRQSWPSRAARPTASLRRVGCSGRRCPPSSTAPIHRRTSDRLECASRPTGSRRATGRDVHQLRRLLVRVRHVPLGGVHPLGASDQFSEPNQTKGQQLYGEPTWIDNGTLIVTDVGSLFGDQAPPTPSAAVTTASPSGSRTPTPRSSSSSTARSPGRATNSPSWPPPRPRRRILGDLDVSVGLSAGSQEGVEV